MVARVKKQSVEMLKDDKHDIALLFYNKGRKCIFTEGMEASLQAAVMEQLEAGRRMEGGRRWNHKAYYAIEKEGAGDGILWESFPWSALREWDAVWWQAVSCWG